MNTKLLFSNACFSSNFQGLSKVYTPQPQNKMVYIQISKKHKKKMSLSNAMILSDSLFCPVYHLLLIHFK